MVDRFERRPHRQMPLVIGGRMRIFAAVVEDAPGEGVERRDAQTDRPAAGDCRTILNAGDEARRRGDDLVARGGQFFRDVAVVGESDDERIL
ncbi:MAG TPA: hypothetical protein VJ853_07875, partial [Thermoanaerobaculia bacterium]|nr:hypothetical protein [Thermoanaerobaculia bacterium]